VKAIWFADDHVGWVSATVLFVRRRTTPSPPTAYSSLLPSRLLTKTTSAPFGDQAGSKSSARSFVSLTSLPSGWMT
jgi:hypothetical protein